MLYLNKLLPVFVLPLGVVALLLLFALWQRKRWPIVAALAILYAASTPFVGNRLIGWLESRYPAVPVAQVETADAVVVLGGILGPKTEPGLTVNWSESVERFEAGVALIQAGKARWLVFTGARLPWEGRETSEGDDLRQLAIGRGITADKILVTAEVSNTADEARAVAEMMHRQGWHRVVLVTTGWHMPRAAYQLKRAGVDCIIFPVDFRSDRRHGISVIDFVPKADAWQETETALRELYGNLFYRLFR